jgi:ABC-type dipeptide/oligopeptide/nickel transport system permease subunit
MTGSAGQKDPGTEGVSAEERDALGGLVPDLLARRFAGDSRSYWRIVWDDFRRNRVAVAALWVMAAMALVLANQRPLVMVSDRGVEFALFRSLRVIDWVLIVGLAQLAAAIIFMRRAMRRDGLARPRGVTVLLTLAATPAVLAAVVGDIKRVVDQGVLWKVTVVIVGLGGLMVCARAAARLYTNRRDQYGRLDTPGATVQLLTGALAVLVASSLVGTLGRPKLDTRDYYREAAMEGVSALFAPIPHEFTGSQAYLVNDRPGGPYIRVVPSGGSQAAVDLGLTLERRDANLAAESGGPLTPGTPLAALRYGDGVRAHDDPMTDFIIVSHSLRRFSVSLTKARTIGDVLAAIDGTGTMTARISADATRIVIGDTSTRRPIHLLGTDENGSDVAARLVRATRVALSIGFVSTGIAIFIGITMGALMGYFGGWVDIVGMRIIEIFMAIPRLFLLLTVIAFIPPSLNEYMLYAMMGVIGAFSWMNSARFIRAEFMRLRDQDFVQAAQACGLPVRSILFRHMLPNGVSPVLVDASFGVAAAIFIETGLSFLGFGIRPPDPSWGQMLSKAVDPTTGIFYWWLAICPGILIFLTVFSFNLIGDALRDAIDPKLKKSH